MERETNVTPSAPMAPPSSAAEIARIEARNALRQFDVGLEMVEAALHGKQRFRLRPSQILTLNRIATEGVSKSAGVIRNCPISISNTPHVPPPASEVTHYLEEMCDYVNDNWEKPPIHLAAFLLWRLNWIHPFEDGNGRSSRMISYVVLCVRLGFLLPGTRTIPDQISADKRPYYLALDAADAACKQGRVDVSVMEQLLSDMLAVQLLDIHNSAVGNG